MKLYDDKEFRVLVADIETLRECFDFGAYDPDTGEWHEFQISRYRNDLNQFIKFYTHQRWDYVVYYNGIDFDGQVVEYILRNHHKWYDFDGGAIARLIADFAQRVIEDKKYDIFLPYREDDFHLRVIDVYRIFGLDNEARRSSLKKCEFQLDFPSVEEMPIHHHREGLTPEDIVLIQSYRRNDVLATHQLLLLAIGELDHPLYKGNNQLQLRADIGREFGIACLNYADIKIGDEVLKVAYAKEIGKEVSDLPKKGFFRKEIKLKHCIPDYVQFQTPQLQKLLADTKKRVIRQTDKFERKITFHGRKYTLAKGGLHADQKNEIWEAGNGYLIEDDDVASYYPNIIINNRYVPYHLGQALLNVYKTLADRRVALKGAAKTDKRIKGIVDALKLALNAVFGKLGNMDSWLFDAQALFSVTLTGEFTLLMLIEMFETAGIRVISANTDGVTTYFREDQKALKDSIVAEWQKLTSFVIETVRFNRFWYSTVNDYIAEQTYFDDTTKEYVNGKPGKIKKKGDFITEFELWKNKSWRVIPLALEAFFKDGTDPEAFITNHRHLWDFCGMARATGELHLEMQRVNRAMKQRDIRELRSREDLFERGWVEIEGGLWVKPDWYNDEEEERELSTEDAVVLEEALRLENDSVAMGTEVRNVKKLVRYYYSSDSDWQLFKRGTGSTGKPMNVNQNAPNELGDVCIRYFNQWEEKCFDDYKIDTDQYVYKALKFLDKLHRTKRTKRFLDSKKPMKQLSLF